jgi:hypothetical protein
MADLIQHRYFETEAAYNAATKKDTDICFIGDTGRIITRSGTFGNAKSVLESLNTYIDKTDGRLKALEENFSSGSAAKADKVQVTQNLSNNTEYPMLWTNANANTEYSQLFKSYANMTFNPAAKRITVGSGGGFRISGGLSTEFLKADGSTDNTAYASTTDLDKYLKLTGGTTSDIFSINANAIYLNTNTEIYLKRKFDTGDKTLMLGRDSIRPANTDSHDYFSLGIDTLRFKNGYFSGTVYANSFSGSLSGNADSATKVFLNYNETANDTYPLIWGNSTNTTSENQGVFKSPKKLYFNPSTGYVTATGFNGKIGSSTIGGTATPIYLKEGTPTACNLPWPADLLSNDLIQQKYLPSYVDDVLEYANLNALKAVTGETGKIYVTTDNNKVYRWTGKDYIEINSSVSTADTAANAANADLAKKATQLATARTLKIGESSKTFDGSADVTWTLDEIGAASTSALNSYLPTAGGKLTGQIELAYAAQFHTTQNYIQFSYPDGGGFNFNFANKQYRPNTTGIWDIGTSGYKFKDGYFSGTVYATTFSGNATTATTATTANKVANTLTIKGGDTTVLTYDGSIEKTFSIKAGTNIGISNSINNGSITISAASYTAGAGLKLDGVTFNVGVAYTTNDAERNYAVKTDTNKNLYVYVPWKDTDTKVTSVGNHYTITSGTAKTTTASGSTLAFNGDVITGVNVDAAGHIYSLTTSKLPSNPNTDYQATESGHYTPSTTSGTYTTTAETAVSGWSSTLTALTGLTLDSKKHVVGVKTKQITIPANPNTDTKVTSVSNHYTPSGGTALTGTSSETLGFGGQVMTGITRDAAGHITGATFKNLPSNPVPSYSFNTGAGGTKTMAEFLTYMTGRTYTSDIRSSVTVNVTTQNIVLFNGYGDLTVTVNMNGWDFANIIIVGHPGSSNGKTVLIQTTGGDDIYENEDCGLITTTSSKYVVEASIVKSSYGTFVSTRTYGKYS